MTPIIHLTSDFTVGPSPAPNTVELLRTHGITAILNIRPDGEDDGQPTSRTLARAAAAEGLSYHHLPVPKHIGLTADVVARAAAIFDKTDGGIYACCATGQRAAMVWAAIASTTRPIEDVLATLLKAGIDLEPLRDDIEAAALSLTPARSAA